MTFHFSYGANMSRAVMRRYAPGARPLGIAALAGYRLIITADGYASVEPAKAATVHGVLWRITPRDRVSLDAWENVDAGLYRAATLPVRASSGCVQALIYFARCSGEGRPKPGYIELILDAAREWQLPADYIGSLESWAMLRPLGADMRKIGAFR
jgi:gamma-glutamylcyclotransferase (GGCT)/AIG2-like uncharacterized protein YtfP